MPWKTPEARDALVRGAHATAELKRKRKEKELPRVRQMMARNHSSTEIAKALGCSQTRALKMMQVVNGGPLRANYRCRYHTKKSA